MKRLIIFVVCLVLVSCSAPDNDISKEKTNETTNTSSEKEKPDIIYEMLEVSDLEFDTNTQTITKYKGSKKNIIIPDEIDGIKILSIGNSAFSNANLEHVQLPNHLEVIEKYAFISNNLNGEIIIPASVKTIGDFAFHGTIEDRFNNITKVKFEENSKCTSVGISAFSHNNISQLNLPKGLISIGSLAFAVNKLSSIKIPSMTTDIAYNAFVYNNVQGEDAFIFDPKDSTKLISYAGPRYIDNLIIPDGTKIIGRKAFRNGYFTGTLAIPDSVEIIEPYAFSNNSFDHINISINSNLTSIGSYSLSKMSYKEILIPSKVTYIGKSALNANLTRIFNKSSLKLLEFINSKPFNAETCEQTIISGTTNTKGRVKVCDKQIIIE